MACLNGVNVIGSDIFVLVSGVKRVITSVMNSHF